MEINKPALIVVILIITFTIVLLFVVPKYGDVAALESELTQKEAEYNNRVSYYSSLPVILQELESQQDSLDKIENALPSRLKVWPIISFLREKAVDSKLTINSVGYSQPELDNKNQFNNLGQIKDVIFNIQLSGNYNGLKAYLSELEKSARLFEVNSITFTVGSQSRLHSIYNFTIEVKTHTY